MSVIVLCKGTTVYGELSRTLFSHCLSSLFFFSVCLYCYNNDIDNSPTNSKFHKLGTCHFAVMCSRAHRPISVVRSEGATVITGGEENL